MADLIIRTTGEVLLGDLEIGRITFTKPYCEAEVAEEYVPESYASHGWGGGDTGDYEELEETYEALEAAAKIAREALTLAQGIMRGVVPKFNWGAAALDAAAIAQLNETPIQIDHALNKLREVL
jgi:hypothetical protein